MFLAALMHFTNKLPAEMELIHRSENRNLVNLSHLISSPLWNQSHPVLVFHVIKTNELVADLRK